MSRDYKHSDTRAGSRAAPLFAGVFIGLVIGLGIALAIAWYLNFKGNPFDDKAKQKPAPAPVAKAPDPSADQPAAAPTAAGTGSRFEFYKILPGVEEPVSAAEAKRRAEDAKGPPPPERLFVQASSFQNASDADNLKARLALLGLEAVIQTVNLGDKGVWHRVRLGPYGHVEEAERVQVTLRQNSIETIVVRVRDPAPAGPTVPAPTSIPAPAPAPPK